MKFQLACQMIEGALDGDVRTPPVASHLALGREPTIPSPGDTGLEWSVVRRPHTN